MSEKKVQKALLDFLKVEGIYAFKTIVTNKAGVPDVIACLAGNFIGFEIKKSLKAKVSELQKLNIVQIINSGGHAMIVAPENIEQTKKFIRDVKAKLNLKKAGVVIR